MINKNYIHLLNYFASKNLLTGESKHVFKKPLGVLIQSPREQKEDKLERKKQTIKQINDELEGYEEGFDKYIKNKSTFEIKGRGLDSGKIALGLLSRSFKKLPKHVKKSKAFLRFFKTAFKDLNYLIGKNAKKVGDNKPCTVTLDEGGKLTFHNKKGTFWKVDLKEASNSLDIRRAIIEDIRKLRAELGKKKEAVVKRTKAKKKVLKKNVQKMLKEDPTKAVDQLVTNKKYLHKHKKGYIVKFLTPKGRIDRKAEKTVRIHDLFDLSKLQGGNIHISFTVSGVSPGGRKFKEEAVYHKGSGTFYIKSSLKGNKRPQRVRIFHNTVISNIKYEAGAYNPDAAKPITKKPKAKSAAKLNVATETNQGTADEKIILNQKRLDYFIEETENIKNKTEYGKTLNSIQLIINKAYGLEKEADKNKLLIEIDKKLKELAVTYKISFPDHIKLKETAAERERERKREAADSLIDDFYYGYIFQNAQYDVPEQLRNDEHFKNVDIWKKVGRYIGPILENPPFHPMSPTQKRHYIQEIIQKQLNSRLYAEDFFKVSLDGKRELYEGGYKQFIKDYYRVEKQMMVRHINEDNPIGKEEKAIVKEWRKLRTIALGIARIFDALEEFKKPEAFKVHRETKTDVYRPMLAGVEQIEKEPQGLNYYSLGSLLHKEDNAPTSIDIGASNLMQAKIKEQFYKQESPDFNPGEMLKSNGGLKLLFMAFGLRKLLAEKCLKKVNDNKYVLVKLPKFGWLEALATIQQTKARLWVKGEHAKADFKKWEKVRASLSAGMKARLFIRSIFTPTGSVVKENFNWWQGLWHGRAVWKKGKKITMAHLGQITINPSEFEKFMAQDRGYLDMLEKTSHRAPGTTVYQPNPTKVLNKTNDYIEYGLTSVIMNATDANFHKVIPKLVKELGIENKIGMDMNSLLNLDKVEILDVLYKALKLNNIEPDQLKGKTALLKLIRVGFMLGRKIETSKKWSEVMNKNLSTRPLERKAQLAALKNGCPVYLLKAVEQKVRLAVIGITNGTIPANVRTQRFGAGMTASVKLFEINGQPQYFTFGVFGQQGRTIQERCIPFLGINGAIKAGKKLSFRYTVGATATFAGAAIGLEMPIGKTDYNLYFSISAGADYKGKTVGVGGAVGGIWDRDRSEKRQVKESMELRNIKDIDRAIDDGKIDKAASLILNHPTFGRVMKKIKTKAKIKDNATIVDLYKEARKDWVEYAKRKMKVPWLLGIGAGAFLGIDAKSGKLASVGVGAYITFKIPGTEVTYVVRHAHPKYSDYMQRKAVEFELRQKLRKQGLRNFKIAPYVIEATSGILYFDSNLGRSGVARRTGEKSANIADGKYSRGSGQEGPNKKPKKKGQVDTFQSTFELAKKTFSKLNIHVEKVKDPRNPKGWLLALTPLQTMDSNVEVLMDPAMKARGLILDRANNRFLLSANLVKDLYVTRSTYRYPFQKRGAMNLHVIAFKANPDLDNGTIRNSSPWSLYKFKGEKYQRVKNEALGRQHYDTKLVNGRPVMTKRPSNVMTLAEYKNSKRNHESFIDLKADYTRPQAQKMTTDLHDAMKYRNIERVRTKKLQLKKFGDLIYADKKFRRPFNIGVGKLKTPDGENKFKTTWFRTIAARYKQYAKQNGIYTKGTKLASLNEQEKNLIYSYLLDKSFTKLLDHNKKYPKVITRRLQVRNRLFMRYMKRFIRKFIENNRDQWKEIRKKYKGASVNGIANYLLLCMPQNHEQLQKFLKSKKSLPLKAGIKYGSYTHRFGSLQSMPTAFGSDTDNKAFKDTLKMIKPTRLNVNSPDANERAAANLILRMMSPLPTKNLEKTSVKKKFLESELSQLLLSMYDRNGVSPLLSILGVPKFKGLTKIIQNLNGKNLETVLKTHAAAFNDFKTIVLGIRNAQLNGESTYTFDNKYIFHVAETKIYAGPYLKCGNGTVAVHQRIGITLKGVKRGRLFGAGADVNIRVGRTEKKAYGQFTAGIYSGHKFKRRKTPTPPRRETPHKTPTQHRAPTQDQTTGGGTPQNPQPDTAVQGPQTEGTGNL
ncbi:hypothetical protein ACFL3T_03175 [Patescibacteria group bacterium]